MFKNNHDHENGRPTVMMTTPGVTVPRFSREPLMTEGEATEGPDHINPFRSEEERRIVEQIKRKRRERRDDELFKTMNASGEDVGTDPELFATGPTEFELPGLEGEDDPFGLKAINPFNNRGPEW